MVLYGYAGQIAKIDLEQKKFEKVPLDENLARKFLGGRGFVAKILWDLLPIGTDPLSKQNILIVSTGILTGHIVPAANRTIFGAKSPLTFGHGDSMMGGFFSPVLKFTGNDALIIKNKAEKLSYLLITEDGISLENASDLQGKGTEKVEKILKEKHTDKCQVWRETGAIRLHHASEWEKCGTRRDGSRNGFEKSKGNCRHRK